MVFVEKWWALDGTLGGSHGMMKLSLAKKEPGPIHILCLGAHSDDIEIGCGGLLLLLIHGSSKIEIDWVVFSAHVKREQEARRSAEVFLKGAHRKRVSIKHFRDGFFPYQGAEIKDHFEVIKREFDPSLILTHWQGDAHQDHRLVSELTWNTFRNDLILEYEIPKYDGDIGRPNLFVPLDAPLYKQKVDYLFQAFESQRAKRWFDRETFLGLMRIRGMESNSPSGYAEAFHARKLRFDP